MTYPPAGGPGQQAGPVPVCPRHPNRESYVRCQRCERPVCPECQRPAAVGVQCVDCVRSQARSMPAARTVFGGRAGSTARVTQVIIAACVLLQFVELSAGNSFIGKYTFVPYLALAEPWRFVTSAFLHSTQLFPFHILFNMYALWIIGPYLEQLLGRVRFIALYLLSAIGGSVGYLLLAGPSFAPGSAWVSGALGASGAVFGLFAALLVVNRKLGRDTAGIVGLIVINGAMGFIIHGIAWQAHLGGLLTGAAVTFALVGPSRERRSLLQPAGVAAVVVLLALLVSLKVSSVPAGLIG